MSKFQIFAGSSNLKLAEKTAQILGKKISKISISRYEDGEFNINILDPVKQKRVFVIQTVCHPIHDNWIELLLIIDALKQNGAKDVIAVIPYLGYSRQERKFAEGKGLPARILARSLEAAGISGVIFVDIHSDKILKYFSVKTLNIDTVDLLTETIEKKKYVAVSPDTGALKKAAHISAHFSGEIAVVEKKRSKTTGKISVKHLIGEVAGRDVLIVDDMITTGSTVLAAANLLKKGGAKTITAAATHAVLANDAVRQLTKSSIEKIIFTDSIEFSDNRKFKKVSIAPLLARAIRLF